LGDIISPGVHVGNPTSRIKGDTRRWGKNLNPIRKGERKTPRWEPTQKSVVGDGQTTMETPLSGKTGWEKRARNLCKDNLGGVTTPHKRG